MIIPKPRGTWQWLAFLSPSVVMVLCSTALPEWLDAKHHHTHIDTIGTAIACGTYGLIASSVLSFGLGCWFARSEMSLLRRFECAMGHGFIIEFVSLLISFPGCVIAGQISR